MGQIFGQTVKAKGGKIECGEITTFQPWNNKRKGD
jgi:hypothetical protein